MVRRLNGKRAKWQGGKGIGNSECGIKKTIPKSEIRNPLALHVINKVLDGERRQTRVF